MRPTRMSSLLMQSVSSSTFAAATGSLGAGFDSFFAAFFDSGSLGVGAWMSIESKGNSTFSMFNEAHTEAYVSCM